MRKTQSISVREIRGDIERTSPDHLAVEEPLEIRVRSDAGGEQTLSVTMRTPGDDAELAAGFLFSEGLLRTHAQVANIDTPSDNTVVVTLAAGATLSARPGVRAFTMTSACGLCGKSSLDELRVAPPGPLPPGQPVVSAAFIHALPGLLRQQQAAFASTGGLHAAGLFDITGRLTLLREDVGRHNAVDKVVGALFIAGALPATTGILMVSGRAGFELVQKAIMAQIPIFAAVGAPSSLSAALAAEAGMTLLGFVRDGRFNVYSDAGRLALPHP